MLFIFLNVFNNNNFLLAEDVAVGVFNSSEDLNILTSSHPLAKLLKASLCSESLVINNEASDFSYELKYFSKINFNNLFWEFEILPELKFSNAIRAGVNDFIFSIKSCLANYPGIKSISSDFDNDNKFIIHFDLEPEAQSLLRVISECPVRSKEHAEIFKDDFGFGSNLVCLGNFKLTNYKKRTEYLLTRNVSIEKAINTILLKEAINDEEGLRLLRSGRLVLYFIENEDILAKVATDTTLKSGECFGHKWIARHDTNYSCTRSFDLASLSIDG